MSAIGWRIALIGLAIAVSAVLLHAQMSSALVARGDELLVRGDDAHARVMYVRAMLFDRSNVDAVDRYVFSAVAAHNHQLLEDSVKVAGAYLRANPSAVIVRFDRALAFQVLRKYGPAAADFGQVGSSNHDVVALTFAGIDAWRAGNLRAAARWLRTAAKQDPSYLPARADLRRLP
jgi:tetratricopeptide (TPR) repeat protein